MGIIQMCPWILLLVFAYADEQPAEVTQESTYHLRHIAVLLVINDLMVVVFVVVLEWVLGAQPPCCTRRAGFDQEGQFPSTGAGDTITQWGVLTKAS